MKLNLFKWFATLTYAGFIYWLSSRPWPAPGNLPPHTDKVVHFFVFAILAWLVFSSLDFIKDSLTHLLSVLILTSAYAFFDEFHQSFVPGRTSDLNDYLADCLGIITLLLIITFQRSRYATHFCSKKSKN